MSTFITLAIFTLCNNLFFLFWWSKVEGKFNTSDLGILLTLLSLFIAFLTSRQRRILNNPVSFLLAFQLLFCLFHIVFVVTKFNYPLFDAIVASRSFLYYFSFFLFLLLLDTRRKVHAVMKGLTVLMMGIIVLSVINYFGPVIFHHEWATGHSARAGIKRAFIPGAYTFTMAAIWSFARTYATGFSSLRWNGCSVLYITAHIFQQSRMTLVGLLTAILGMGIQQRRFVLCGYAAFIVIFSSLFLQEVLNVDILGENLRMTISDIQNTKGTYGVRMLFLKKTFNEFMESPLFGTGGSAIRAYHGAYSGIPRDQFARFYVLGKQTDIGVFNWIKDFGLIGLTWLITFFAVMISYARRALRDPAEDKSIAMFGSFYLVFVMVTSLTTEHMINAITIPPVMLASAILVRMRYGWKEEAA